MGGFDSELNNRTHICLEAAAVHADQRHRCTAHDDRP
jgi:hypothetical protein